MAKIDARDFGDYVENQKNRLYEHCRENNVYVDKNASLEKIVDANNLIKNPDENIIKVRVFDYDGELLDTQYYNVGETVPEPPAPIPKDSRLKFKKWIRAVDSLIAERDFDFGALYESTVTKEVDGYTCKVTSFDCSFDEEYTGLNVSIPFGLSNFKIFVDWGDGTEITTLTNSGKATHTYSENGDYTIQIYGYPTSTTTINWYFNTSGSTYLLGSKILNRALKQAIISSEYLLSAPTCVFYYAVNLKTIILDTGILFTRFTMQFLRYCSNLRGLVIPETIDTIESNAMEYNYNNKIVLSQNCKILYNILDKSVPFTVIIPDNIQQISLIESKSYKKLILNSLIGNTSPKISYIPNLELLDFGNISTTSITNPIDYNYNLTTLILPKNLLELKSGMPYCPKLKTLVIPDSVVTISSGLFSSDSYIENLTIPNNWSSNIDFLKMSTLNINSWISIANRIKDLTGENAKIITMLAQYYSQLKDVYLNSNGEQVDKNTEGAINILDFIRNKNWTVTIA